MGIRVDIIISDKLGIGEGIRLGIGMAYVTSVIMKLIIIRLGLGLVSNVILVTTSMIRWILILRYWHCYLI